MESFVFRLLLLALVPSEAGLLFQRVVVLSITCVSVNFLMERSRAFCDEDRSQVGSFLFEG